MILVDLNDVRMSSEDANAFIRKARGWFSIELRHECYDEGCTFEEVEETIGNRKAAVSLLIGKCFPLSDRRMGNVFVLESCLCT